MEGYWNITVIARTYSNTTYDYIIIIVDLTCPIITNIIPSNNSYLNSSDVTVSWTGSDNFCVDHSEIRIDSGSWFNVGTSTSYTFVGLGEGSHTVDVRVYDVAGNYDSARVTFYIDLTSPTVTITFPANGSYFNITDVTIYWTGDDNMGVDHYEVRIDSGSWIDVGTGTNYTFSGFDEGNHTVRVRVVDVAGNVHVETLCFVIDLSPPTVSIMHPDAYYDNEAYVSWYAEDNASYVCRVEIYLNGSLCATYVYGVNMTSIHYFDLPDGKYNISVVVHDAVNHTSEDHILVVFDTTRPNIILSSPENNTWHNKTDIILAWSGNDNFGIDHYEIRVDDEEWINVGMSTNYVLNLSEGSHDIMLKAIDLAGNTRVVTVRITIDVTPPSIILVEPSTDIVSSSTIRIKWGMLDNFEIQYVKLYVDAALIYVGNDTEYVYQATDGWHIICVIAYDRAGNTARAAKTILVDTTEPIIAITCPADGQYINTSTVAITWEYEELNLDHLEMRIDYGEWVNIGNNTTIVVELEDGRHIVEVKIYDVAGNIAKDSVIFTVDTTPPTITILEPENNSEVTDETITIRLYVSDANLDKVLIRTDGGWIELQGNEYTVSLNKGENRIWIRATDKAGNTRTVVLIVTLKKIQLMPYVFLALIPIISLAVFLGKRKKRKKAHMEQAEGKSETYSI